MSEINATPGAIQDIDAARAREMRSYPRVTAAYCEKHYTTPQRNIQMLTREFIHDSLYHPHYGYFSKHALIFSSRQPYNFGELRDSAELLAVMGDQYHEIEQELDDVSNIPRQLWHTPTELLKPWYGRSVARYIVDEFKSQHSGDADTPLVMYEVGAGNGTLMMNIMDYLCDHEPELYSRAQYNIIEISTKLAKQQRWQLQESVAATNRADGGGRHQNVNIINKSIFDWDEMVGTPCFFIAMEVIDNFAHDVVRYDYKTGAPYQGFAALRADGEFEEWFEPVSDPLIKRYLEVRDSTKYVPPALRRPWARSIRWRLPFAPNLTAAEYLPTRAFQFCEVLHRYFPKHRLVLSDFFELPDTIAGQDAPVVQTRFRGTMVPCTTYLVQPGWFDIFFPTNFELLRDVYHATGRKHAGRDERARILTQREFSRRYAELEQTRTRSGENPMLDFYENNKLLLS
ncbi:hypothetical protein EV182_000387 [Spiromyces aspiralis]|uniref:Uncharacterized protein n=1 Tax=Spiromyces aspiralis TaxID=68401 RepID=A0ACC1HVD2_9FUNG|nr:hypothetical protein EV182_000387 [Spiromyces aspiralis]